VEEHAEKFSSVPPPDLGRDRIGRYDIIYPLAQGGMASVYVGRLPGIAGFEKLVALKVIHPHLSREREFVDMFLDEARLAARIHHPNVGEIFEMAEDDGLFFMVGELVQGHSLRSFMKRARALGLSVSQPIAAFISAKVCQGLQAAHELRGPEGEPMHLVHRDVSPRNILLSYDGFVKLIDFGVAWAKDRISQTEAGLLKGKVGYMPPEQIRGQTMDARSDVFSLGVVMYLMVTGNHPFPGNSDAERMHKILNSKFPAPRKANPGLYPAMEQIILTAMAGNPQDRYETAAHMGQELKKFIRNTGESLGAAELSVLMHSLFAAEKEEHEKRVRAFHRQAEDREKVEQSFVLRSSRPVPPDDGFEQAELRDEMHSLAGGPTVPDEESVDGESFNEESFNEENYTEGMSQVPGLTGRWKLLAALGGVLLGGTIVMIALMLMSRPDSATKESADPATGSFVKVSPDHAGASAEAVRNPEAAVAPEVVSPKPRFVSIGLSLEPASARVSVDGEPVDVRDGRLLLPLSAESHRLEVAATGYATHVAEFVADQDRQVEIRLVKASKAAMSKQPATSERSNKTGSGLPLELRGSPY
jgi:serine/threonine-protein kinase